MYKTSTTRTGATPITLVRWCSIPDQFLNKDGKVYCFDNRDNVPRPVLQELGSTYYFGPDGARYTDQFLNKDGKVYYFDCQE